MNFNMLLKKKYVVFPIVLVILVGCLLLGKGSSRGPYDPQLVHIDSLLNQEDLDTSAVSVAFRRVSTSLGGFDDDNRMYYNLLTQFYQFKTYQPVENDSVLRVVIQYYGDEASKEGLLANYIGAGMYYDRKEYEKAQDCGLRFLRMTDETSDYDKLMRIKCHIFLGDIYSFHTEKALSLRQFKSALYWAEVENDTLLMAEGNYALAQAYRESGMYDAAFAACGKAYHFFKAVGDKVRTSWMWLEYAQICNHFHLDEKTAYYLKHLEKTADWISKDHLVVPGMNRECYYQAKAKQFENTNSLDSAIVFYKRELTSADFDFLHDASKALCRLYLKTGDVDSLRKYQNIYEKYKQRHEATHDGYALQRKQMEFDEARQTKQRVKQIWKFAFAVMAGISLLVAGLYLIVWHYRRRRGRIVVKRGSDEQEEPHNDSTEKAASLAISQGSVSAESKSGLGDDGDMSEKADCLTQSVDDSNLLVETCQPRHVVDYVQCEAILSLKEMAERQQPVALTNHLRKNLMEFVHKEDIFFGDFLDGLQKKERRIGKNVIFLCLLIRAGFTLTEISSLLAVNASAVCNMRARLARKILNDEKALAKHLDEYIRGIP